MRIAVVGGGVTGLTAAYELTKRGHKVTIFEKEKTLGGLAAGFKQPEWDWHLEYAYHHLFTNDGAIIDLIDELGLSGQFIVKRPITATYWKNNIYRMDSPVHLLRFPGIPIIDRLRTGLLLSALKLNPFWQPLESITAYKLFRSLGGKKSWDVLWEPLMAGKFGGLSHTIAASWFWARIKKRTPSLCYIAGGFHTLISALEHAIKQRGGTIYTDCDVRRIEWRTKNLEWRKKYGENQNSPFSILSSNFDTVLLTVPTPIAQKLVSPFSILHSPFFQTIPHLHAQTLILETKEPILKEVYWLNITDRSFPFLAVVAHTNLIDKKYYGGHHLTYFGNYLPEGHPYLSMTKKQLLRVFLPYINRLNPHFHWSDLSDWSDLFIGYYAQPVHELHYSKKAPKLETPIPNLFLANLDSVYPWDRGTNYAVELGKRAAMFIEKEAKQ